MGERYQQQQRLPLLRSYNNVHKSFVRFINKTLHNVILYWMDYQGQAVSYGVLAPDDCRLIDTFDKHPWVFVDQETGDRYVANQRDVFFPDPWFGKNRSLEHSETPVKYERTDVYITLPVYTLRDLSLRAIRQCLTHDQQAFQLEIPRSLQLELADMLPQNKESEDAQKS
ncbi:Von Hippel-Lindau disease tumor suppressor [Eufriesea mexicana]|uniref:von Hippel-Lindau disease tumor suppressor n=1 Tax=Eufriesea mexicana TaxID=516756 RepID=A0A310SHP3_9HYME|nr:PREDICTED: von Hippel-Lindau disease tumor suppressor-like [Eufriesea mexicana]XP_017761784.1 PREDICTED: von Hippel-Lindau disease tumor suppressor-like [Eufriesea mexicana]OAD54125.1 Von Hippel-Lindau disease tumor suppressor [Eufriesea mexicana]OAD62197.1 Von Hippel-Lindau disease tumor suppressor [Eufriesea mexicana]